MKRIPVQVNGSDLAERAIGPALALAALLHNHWVVFQVDEIHDEWNWDSVVVRGGIHIHGEGADAEDRPLKAQAIATLQEEISGGLGESDVVPHRTILFGLGPHEVVGRSARLRSG